MQIFCHQVNVSDKVNNCNCSTIVVLLLLQPSMASSHEEEVNKIRSKIDKMEDEIYRDFCNQIGVSNIRCESMRHETI